VSSSASGVDSPPRYCWRSAEMEEAAGMVEFYSAASLRRR
jgi:hypothetical protein